MFTTEHVILLTIDGVRATEFLEDTTHATMPRIWNDLRPLACISHSFYNIGMPGTVPGHGSIGAGKYQYTPNDGSRRSYQPLLWECLRDQSGISDSSVVIAIRKEKTRSLSFSTSSGYGPPDSAVIIGPFDSDPALVSGYIVYSEGKRPVLSMVCLAEVDIEAHTGDWDEYINAIVQSDSLVGALWDWIESTPGFAGKTTLIIIADHGRHVEDWTVHGCTCQGCRHIPLIALGPDFKNGIEIYDPPREQIDIAPTVASLLGFQMPYAHGAVMIELFKEDLIPP